MTIDNTGAKTFLRRPFYSLVQCNLSSFFPTFTAGWRPESNRASFLMMLPTPGMIAWSMRTSHNIRRHWLLTASSEQEKLNCWEHTSRPSIALTLCTQSSVNLQTYTQQGQLLHPWNNTTLNSFFHVVLPVLFMRWNSKGEISGSRNKCLSGKPNNTPQSHSQWTGQMSGQKDGVFHATTTGDFRHRLM